MADVDLVDETFVSAAPATVAAVVADRQRWSQWWPDLDLTVFMDRGDAGIRWSVGGAWRGSAEIWLEPVVDGTLIHHYLRLIPAAGSYGDDPGGRRRAARERARRARSWKQHVWALKDALEGDRPPGEPARG